VELISLISVALLRLTAPLVPLFQGREARERRKRWHDALLETGVERVEQDAGSLVARTGALRIRLSFYQESESIGTRLEISGPDLASGLTLLPEGRQGMFFRSRHPKETEVGDEDFDRLVSVQGPPALALAVLDADMRRTVRALLRGSLEVRGHRPLWASGSVRDGVLRVDLPQRAPQLRRQEGSKDPPQGGDAYLDGEHKLPAVMRAALDLAARLIRPDDLASRLASNMLRESEAGVRLRTLQVLLREFPRHAATREAVRAGYTDPDAEVRVPAAIALGPDGRDVLLGVAHGEGAEDATSARAVKALGTSLTLAQAGDLLRSALRTRRLKTAMACMVVLGHHAGDATPPLGRVLLVEKGELAEAAARALASGGHPSAEAPLLRALAEGAPRLRRAAAEALGHVGTRSAVLPLREAEADAELRGIARQAIAQIHSRLAGAGKGQLSLASGESGRLSIADEQSGQLSLSASAPEANPRPEH
jgi:hypothetical protein